MVSHQIILFSKVPQAGVNAHKTRDPYVVYTKTSTTLKISASRNTACINSMRPVIVDWVLYRHAEYLCMYAVPYTQRGQDPESGACDPKSLLYKQSTWHYDMHGKYKKLNYRVNVVLQRVGNLRRLRFRISWKRSAWFQKMKACSEGGPRHYAEQSEGRNRVWPCFSTWHCGFNTLWATGSD